jgi:hypothetical protein
MNCGSMTRLPYEGSRVMTAVLIEPPLHYILSIVTAPFVIFSMRLY